MSEITGTPSEGHPFPLNGSQNGDEYGRVPTSVIGVPPGAPVIVQAAGAFTIGQGMFGPPGVAGEAYGRWNVVPAGQVNELEGCRTKSATPPKNIIQITPQCPAPSMLTDRHSNPHSFLPADSTL